MVIVELFIDLGVYQGLTLKKNHEYVMSGAVMRQLLKLYPGGLSQTRKFEDVYRKVDLEKLKKGDEVFLFRSGGIGDVMFMVPLAVHLIKEYGVTIKLGTSPMYSAVINGNPYIKKVVQMPFDVKEMEKSNYHLIFEGAIEDNPERAQKLHAVDLFLEEAGVDFTKISAEEKIPKIYLEDSEISIAKKKVKEFGIDTGAKKIGIQVEASSPIRTIPLDKIIAVTKKFLGKGYVVFVFGGKRQEGVGKYLQEILLGEKNFVNLISADQPLRESVAIVSLLDVIIAPDSAFVHIAGGLGVPVVGLYGCFPSKIRMKYYKNAIGIDCGVKCAPSFIHGHSPCDKGFPSPCFSVISPEDILNAVDHLQGEKNISLLYSIYNEFINGKFVESPFSIVKVEKK